MIDDGKKTRKRPIKKQAKIEAESLQADVLPVTETSPKKQGVHRKTEQLVILCRFILSTISLPIM